MPNVPQSPDGLVLRIPVPPDCEEVEVKRRVSVLGKPGGWITVVELRQRRQKSVAKPVAATTKKMVEVAKHTPVKKPAKIKPKPAKKIRSKGVPTISKRKLAPLPKCPWCGRPTMSGHMHPRCQEAKARVEAAKKQ